MIGSGYFPPGAEYSPLAPWNREDMVARPFDVFISQTLSKNTKIYTNDYTQSNDNEENTLSIDTSDTNWREAYLDNALTPLQLISLCKKMAKKLLEEGEISIGRNSLKDIIDNCEDWIEDDLEVMEY